VARLENVHPIFRHAYGNGVARATASTFRDATKLICLNDRAKPPTHCAARARSSRMKQPGLDQRHRDKKTVRSAESMATPLSGHYVGPRAPILPRGLRKPTSSPTCYMHSTSLPFAV
jgi:hypothetical protein